MAKLKQCIDVAAVIAVAYLPLCLLWTRYENAPPGPLTTGDISGTIGMAFSLLGFVWLAWKYGSAARGTYPFWDRCMHDGRSRALTTISIVFVWFALTKIVDVVRR